MQRILDPAQIEAFAQASIPRLRLADPARLFLKRAARLRQLSEKHSIGAYLTLMAAVCEAQHTALGALGALPVSAAHSSKQAGPRIARAREHGMPLLEASGWARDGRWRTALSEVCRAVAALEGFPEVVPGICTRIRAAETTQLEEQADRLLARTAGVDVEAAPFIMAALQVYWVHLATTLAADEARELAAQEAQGAQRDIPGVCPVCGTLPVASVVRADAQYQGYRYLHCGLCATEWHLVRIKCSHCLATEGIRYHYVAGGSEAVRAETCDNCRMYRKILYQEKDAAVESVADDLGSLALDLLMAAEGYQRASGNPLLWQGAAD
jgi:FdhE protein